ncbi:MAG: hypothetical protein JW747_07250 [Candidatus Aminicenantes bacterium]|nr:hypothetical protein [Candidatus Aminicenantes bacterium]
MKSILAGLSALLLAAAVVRAQQSPPEVHGHFSFSFLRGEAESDAPSGSFEDIGGGLSLSGLFAANFDYRFELRSRAEARFGMEEAWLGFNPFPAFGVRAGLYLVPFGRFNRFNRPHENLLAGTPLPFTSVTPESWRDIGLLASGRTSFLFYALSLGNGLGENEAGEPEQQFRDNNASKDVVGRLGIQWKAGLETAVSYSRQEFGPAGARRADLLGADASWITDNYRILGEYVRMEKDDAAGGRVNEEGWYVQLALDYKSLWPVASYQRLKTDPAASPAVERRRWTVGLAGILFSGTLLKFEYAWNREPDAEVDNDLFSVQVAVSF